MTFCVWQAKQTRKQKKKTNKQSGINPAQKIKENFIFLKLYIATKCGWWFKRASPQKAARVLCIIINNSIYVFFNITSTYIITIIKFYGSIYQKICTWTKYNNTKSLGKKKISTILDGWYGAIIFQNKNLIKIYGQFSPLVLIHMP